jgi:hypothetical protein
MAADPGQNLFCNYVKIDLVRHISVRGNDKRRLTRGAVIGAMKPKPLVGAEDPAKGQASTAEPAGAFTIANFDKSPWRQRVRWPDTPVSHPGVLLGSGAA